MQSLEFAVPLASNRKVVRQFASNPKGREHKHHGPRGLQRTKGPYEFPTVAHSMCS